MVVNFQLVGTLSFEVAVLLDELGDLGPFVFYMLLLVSSAGEFLCPDAK